ncbi:MAG: hypothetical protein A4E54_01755 [Pelotomaculum sp. PtaB.Bin117]|nr:MAG: hypothetical protein A4E54_01755 [Pelotomaculum sp. PtaB.Bin117]OPY60370.1 MAG: hypothetical protein A4E56_02736 [Pelotomaculum sp. PtaU1.Bin065]
MAQKIDHLEEVAEGYKAMLENDIEIYLPAQAEVVLRDDK